MPCYDVEKSGTRFVASSETLQFVLVPKRRLRAMRRFLSSFLLSAFVQRGPCRHSSYSTGPKQTSMAARRRRRSIFGGMQSPARPVCVSLSSSSISAFRLTDSLPAQCKTECFRGGAERKRARLCEVKVSCSMTRIITDRTSAVVFLYFLCVKNHICGL